MGLENRITYQDIINRIYPVSFGSRGIQPSALWLALALALALALPQKGSIMPYWQLFYHFVWATKGREAILTPEVEAFVYKALRTKAIGLGAKVFALNGTTDHSHLVASVPPSIAVATFVGQVKAVASVKFNQSGLSQRPDVALHFAWQEQYGVFSFDGKRLPYLIAYVEQQKEHHAARTVISLLERVGDEGVHMVREDIPSYGNGLVLPDADEWGDLPV